MVRIQKPRNFLYLFILLTVTSCPGSTQYPTTQEPKTAQRARVHSDRTTKPDKIVETKETDRGRADHESKATLKKYFPTKQLEKEGDIKWSHAPYNSGKCSLCHKSDNAEKPGPMKADVNKLCLGCHKKSYYIPKGRDGLHEPVMKDCGYCHNAHNAKFRYLLYTSIPDLCLTCHEKEKRDINSRFTHEPVTQDKRCETCHDSHGSDFANCLKLPMARLCVDCHGNRTEPIKDKSGRVLADIQALKQKKVKHEPFENDDCSACHNPHGAEYIRLLKSEYPEDFYSKYTDENYQLCYECHIKERITTPQTSSLTGFRKGNRNLHYVHVVKPEKGRSCRSCHGDHATSADHLIRSRVPYGPGGWLLEIHYEPFTNGGRCSKTCHHQETYDNGGVRPKDIGLKYRKLRQEREKD